MFDLVMEQTRTTGLDMESMEKRGSSPPWVQISWVCERVLQKGKVPDADSIVTMAKVANAVKAQKEKIEAIRGAAVAYLVASFPEGRSNPHISLTRAIDDEQQVLEGAYRIIQAHEKDLSQSAQYDLIKSLLLSHDTQVALRNTQRQMRENTTAVARSRRLFHWQMSLAKTEVEKERLRHERKLYISRKWYRNNQARERARSKQRNRRNRDNGNRCCPYTMLGAEPCPKKSVKLWITQCKTCKRQEYGDIGCNDEGRVGIHFRGEWFDYIDPQTGKGTTFTGEIISLTRIY